MFLRITRHICFFRGEWLALGNANVVATFTDRDRFGGSIALALPTNDHVLVLYAGVDSDPIVHSRDQLAGGAPVFV